MLICKEDKLYVRQNQRTSNGESLREISLRKSIGNKKKLSGKQMHPCLPSKNAACFCGAIMPQAPESLPYADAWLAFQQESRREHHVLSLYMDKERR